jgi:hypothetical protein
MKRTLTLISLFIALCGIPLSVNAWTYTFSTTPKPKAAELPSTAKPGEVYMVLEGNIVEKMDLKPGDTYVVTTDGTLRKVTPENTKPNKASE